MDFLISTITIIGAAVWIYIAVRLEVEDFAWRNSSRAEKNKALLYEITGKHLV
jgi:hypothetical protein